ncbi:hypothetical protein HK102_010851, partial [Quaeritorhiza haematococci]
PEPPNKDRENLRLKYDLDPVDLAIIDQLISIHSDAFVGNLHSSFSRHVIEGRMLSGKGWDVF